MEKNLPDKSPSLYITFINSVFVCILLKGRYKSFLKRFKSKTQNMRSLKKDKRGIQLTLETILLLILMVAAVIMLSLFFTQSSNKFFGKIKAYFVHTNVDSIIGGCNVLSSTEASYAFCCEKKDVKYYMIDEGGRQIKTEGDFTCGELVEESFINGKINQLNCEEISC